jgi:hypothetical protein
MSATGRSPQVCLHRLDARLLNGQSPQSAQSPRQNPIEGARTSPSNRNGRSGKPRRKKKIRMRLCQTQETFGSVPSRVSQRVGSPLSPVGAEEVGGDLSDHPLEEIPRLTDFHPHDAGRRQHTTKALPRPR